jgi:holo-[acyl-carrier protein] synthase
MKVATGIDLVEMEQFQAAVERHGRRFLERIFTENELADCGENIHSLAARFAVKEAVSKALGTGIGAVAWREIEVQRGKERQPQLRLCGAAEQLAAELGLSDWSISLSHTKHSAAAVVVAIGK